MQLEAYLEEDDRVVLPLGSTEQHAYLSLGTDSILAERVAVEAAEPLGVPVLPALPVGLAETFAAYPGSPTLSRPTYAAVLREIVGSLRGQGFARILVVNGHGGNTPVATELAGDGLVWHDWWRAPRVWATVQEIDPEAGHASWMENFPWTRLPRVDMPDAKKPAVEWEAVKEAAPEQIRATLGDGSFGGLYRRPDADVLRLWQVGVEETRAVLERGWPG